MKHWKLAMFRMNTVQVRLKRPQKKHGQWCHNDNSKEKKLPALIRQLEKYSSTRLGFSFFGKDR